MSDVAPRAFTKTNVFTGRVTGIKCYTAAGTPSEVKLELSDLNPAAAFTATEEVKTFMIELEDGTEMINRVARLFTLEVKISELDTTDMAIYAALTKLTLTTEGTVKTLIVDAPDISYCRNQNMMTVITVKKSTAGDTLGYAVS
jgi:hypothetical protein